MSLTVALGGCDLLQDSKKLKSDKVLIEQINGAKAEYEEAQAQQFKVHTKYIESKAKSKEARQKYDEFTSKENESKWDEALANEMKI